MSCVERNCATRRRSATTLHSPQKDGCFNLVSVSVSLPDSLASIANWAANIAPGSPSAPSPRASSFYSASPKSPRFSLSVLAHLPRTPHRRASVSTTFLNLWETPSSHPHTPAPKPVSPRDLLAQGYTSVFVHFPSLEPESTSPTSKLPPFLLPRPRAKSLSRSRSRSPIPPAEDDEKPKPLARLRSFSLKGKTTIMHMLSSKAIPPVPALPAHTMSSSRERNSKSTPHKRYGALLAPGGGAGALPLSQEVALSQMLDGGSLDVNVRRVTDRHARDTGSHPNSRRDEGRYAHSRSHAGIGGRVEGKDRRPLEMKERGRDAEKVGGGVSGVYRDARGGLWWDEDESLELAGLLPTGASGSPPNQPTPLGTSNVHNVDGKEKEKRRGLLPRLMTSSKASSATQHQQNNEDWVPLHSPGVSSPTTRLEEQRRGSATSESDADLDPAYAVRPRDSSAFAAGYSVEVGRHLRRPAREIEAFGGAIGPLDVGVGAAGEKRERRERRRPAPLTLPLPLPHPPSSQAPTTSTVPPPPPMMKLPHPLHPTHVEREGRREYFASSFAPAPAPPSSTPPYTLTAQSQTKSQKSARRGSLSLGVNFLALTTKSGAKRASVASESPSLPSPLSSASRYVHASAKGSNAHLPLALTNSASASSRSARPGTPGGHEGGVPGTGRGLRSRASRSRLAGLFKRG